MFMCDLQKSNIVRHCCSAVSGNANLVARKIAEKVPPGNTCVAITILPCSKCLSRRHQGSFMQFILISNLLARDRRVSYAQEGQLFHVLVADGITFLCMADEVSLHSHQVNHGLTCCLHQCKIHL